MGRILAIAVLAVIAGVGVTTYLQSTDDPTDSSVTVAADVTEAATRTGTADATADDETDESVPDPDDGATAPTTDEVEEVAASAPEPEPAIDTPPVLGERGDLENLDGWLQSDITSLDELDGTVHVVQFWTFGCFNCKNTLDNMAALYERHADDDFEVVGVHAPEFDYEKDPASILAAAEDLNVTWPIALDTEKTNFRSWQEGRRFWPRTFVVDQEGQIRFDRIGEGAYQKLNDTVAWLLENPPAA